MADVDSDSDDSDLEDQPKKLNKSFSSQKSQCRNTENIEIVVDRMIAPSDQPNSISRDDNAILPPPVIQLEDYQSSSAVPAIKIDQGIPTSLHQNILIHTSSEASLIHQKDRNNVTIGRLDQVHLSTIKMNDQSPSSARNSPKLSPKTTPILKHRDRPLSQGNLKISTNVADQSNVLQQQLQQQPQQQPFSWYNDGEDSIKSKSRRSTCCGQCVLFYDSWPLFFKSIFKSSIGVILFMTPGLFSYYLFIPDKCRSSVFTNRCHEATIMMLGPYPFFVHAVVWTILWCAWFGVAFCLEVLPEVLLRIIDLFGNAITDLRAQTISHYMDYLRHLHFYISLVVWSAISLACWSSFFIIIAAKDTDLYDPNDSLNWQTVVKNLLSCLLFCSLIWMVEKFLLQIFSVQFHKRAYSDRLDKTNYALAILEKLNKARKANKRNRIKKSQEIGPSLPPGSAPISPPIPDSPEHHSPSKTEGSLPLNPSPVHSYTSKIREKASGVSQGILSVFGAAVGADLGLSVGVILRTPADAKKLAKKLFESLCKRSEEVIIPSDFEPYFSSKEDASTAFRIFDRDGNGEVSKHEMKVTILETFRDNQSLENSIRQSSQAIKKLDSILMVIVIIIALFVCLSIWNVNTTSYLVTFATVWASIVFSVSNVISSLVQSIILLFVSHPYDVGDRVDIDNESFTVVKFGLTSTTFRRSDGKECYVPNSSLTSKTICNIRRSGPQNEKVELVISSDTPHEKINELQTLLLDYLTNEETKDFAPKIDIVIKDIIDNRSMTISMSLEHKTNWQEGGKKSQRRNRFMWKLKELVSQAGIQLIGHEKN